MLADDAPMGSSWWEVHGLRMGSSWVTKTAARAASKSGIAFGCRAKRCKSKTLHDRRTSKTLHEQNDARAKRRPAFQPLGETEHKAARKYVCRYGDAQPPKSLV